MGKTVTCIYCMYLCMGRTVCVRRKDLRVDFFSPSHMCHLTGNFSNLKRQARHERNEERIENRKRKGKGNSGRKRKNCLVSI